MGLSDWFDLDDINSEIQELEEAFAINEALGDDWVMSDSDELSNRLESLYNIRESLENSDSEENFESDF